MHKIPLVGAAPQQLFFHCCLRWPRWSWLEQGLAGFALGFEHSLDIHRIRIIDCWNCWNIAGQMIHISYRGVGSKLFLAATGPLHPLVAPQMLLPSTSWVGRRRWSSEEQKSFSSQIMLAPKESFDLVSDLRWMVDGCLPPLKKWLLLLSASSILSGRAGRPCKRSRKLQKQFLNETKIGKAANSDIDWVSQSLFH